MRRISIEQRDERLAAARCAQAINVPSIRWRDVLIYWRAMNKQYAFGRRRFANPKIARARRAAWRAEYS